MYLASFRFFSKSLNASYSLKYVLLENSGFDLCLVPCSTSTTRDGFSVTSFLVRFRFAKVLSVASCFVIVACLSVWCN